VGPKEDPIPSMDLSDLFNGFSFIVILNSKLFSIIFTLYKIKQAFRFSQLTGQRYYRLLSETNQVQASEREGFVHHLH